MMDIGYKIILASNSPRRRELLAGLGLKFDVRVLPDIDETYPDTLPVTETAEYIAVKKSQAYRQTMASDELIITADTVVIVGDEVLGKPVDASMARQMLLKLSGRTHQVITGLSVLSSSRQFQDVSISHVTFASLSDEEIDAYVSSGECDDKAGAYAIQGGAGKFITRIDGDYYAIMGLPLNSVYEELKSISDY
jgi:septum formation protein